MKYETQIEEYDDLSKARDDIIFFAKRYLDINLYDYQKEMIKADKARRIVARQMGFSMMSCIKALHTAIFNECRNIAYVSVNLSQAYSKSEYIYKLLAIFNSNLGSIPQVKIKTGNKKYLQLENRSQILFCSYSGSSSMRGRTFSDLYLEDVNFARESDFNEFINSVLPACASGKNVKLWSWSTIKRVFNNFETGDVDNIYKLNWAEIEHVPFWFKEDSSYSKYKYLEEFLTPEQIKKEYLLEV